MAQFESKRKKKAQEIRNKAKKSEKNVEENLMHSQWSMLCDDELLSILCSPTLGILPELGSSELP